MPFNLAECASHTSLCGVMLCSELEYYPCHLGLVHAHTSLGGGYVVGAQFTETLTLWLNVVYSQTEYSI